MTLDSMKPLKPHLSNHKTTSSIRVSCSDLLTYPYF